MRSKAEQLEPVSRMRSNSAFNNYSTNNSLRNLNKENKVNSFLHDHHDQSNYMLCCVLFFLIKTITETGPTEHPVYKTISKHLLETRGLAGEERSARSDSSLE